MNMTDHLKIYYSEIYAALGVGQRFVTVLYIYVEPVSELAIFSCFSFIYYSYYLSYSSANSIVF
jgi:hypothetical protein